MRRSLRLVVVLLIVAALHSSAFGGGNRCPPRVGVIAKGEAGAILFIDSADKRSYELNTIDEASMHINHRVRIVTHVIPETPNTLFVHSFTCLGATAGRMPA